MRTSDTTAKLFPALVAALADMKNPPKTATARLGQYSYTYATLPEILDAARPVLAKNGLAILQETATTRRGRTTNEGAPAVVTRIVHSSGEWIETAPIDMPPMKADPQGIGGALTYARRYSLTALLGIAGEDDDDGGYASSGGSQRTSESRPPADAQKAPSGRSQGEPRPAGYRFNMDEVPHFQSGDHVFSKGPKRGAWDEWTWGQMALEHMRLLYADSATPESSPISNMIANEFVKGWNTEQAEKIDADGMKKIDGGWTPDPVDNQPADPPEDERCSICGLTFADGCTCVPF